VASHDSRTFELKTPLGKDVLLLKAMHGIEGMSQPFQWDLDLLSEKNDIDPDAITCRQPAHPMTIKSQSVSVAAWQADRSHPAVAAVPDQDRVRQCAVAR